MSVQNLFYLASAPLLCWGTFLLAKTIFLLAAGVRAEADVYYVWIDHERTAGPYITYTTRQQQKIDKRFRQIKITTGSEDEPEDPSRRKTIVFYFPAWPAWSVEKTFGAMYGIPALLLLLGGAFLYAALVIS